MKDELEGFLKKFGAFKVAVADPKHGFEMAKEGCHPRDVMKNCNSVIVFAFHVGLDYYTSLDYFQKGDVESRVLSIYRDWVSFHLLTFLEIEATTLLFHMVLKMKKRKSLAYPLNSLHTKRDSESSEDQAQL